MQTTKRFGSQRDAAPAGGPEGDRAGKVARTDRLIQRKARSRAAVTTVAADIDPPASDVLPSANESFVDSLLRPIQRRATAETSGTSHEDGNDAHAAASAGIAGPPQALPHLEAIQASFGAHDISGVKAHSDETAATAATAMGATAFATGEHVAFASPPDLHTAAHEAAHVVQQRGGVRAPGAVGASGDRYEQHADRVAAAVVAGAPAEALLNELAEPGTGASIADVVQRRTPGDENTAQVSGPAGPAVAHERSIERFKDLSLLVFDAMLAGVVEATSNLEYKQRVEVSQIRQLVELAASGAVAGSAGVIAQVVARKYWNNLRERFINDVLKDSIKKALKVGASAGWESTDPELVVQFQRAQLAKIRRAKAEFVSSWPVMAAALGPMPSAATDAAGDAAFANAVDAEVPAAIARQTSVEWANLVARLHHGVGGWDAWADPETGSAGATRTAQAAPPPAYDDVKSSSEHPSRGNVDQNSASMRDIVDLDQTKMNPDGHGLLEIDLFGYGTYQLYRAWGHGIRMGGVSEYVRRRIAEFPTVGAVRVNKVVSVFNSSTLAPPKPAARILVTADGYVRRTEGEETIAPSAVAFAQALSPRSLGA